MNVNIEHLYRRKETYYFRIKIPAALQKYFDRVEVHKTLKTTELNIAREMCILLLKKFDNLFGTVRMEVSKNKLDNSEIRALVSRLLKEIIDGYEEFIATSGEISPEKLKKAINNLEVGINILQDALAHNRLDFIFSRDEAKYLLRFHDYTENDLSKTAREILKMRIGEFQAKLGILKGKGVNPYDIRLLNQAVSTAVPAATNPAPQVPLNTKAIPLGKLIQMYIRDKNSRKFWSARTHTQVGGTLKILHSHFGEVDLNTLKHADMMDFRDNVLMKIPSRMEISLKFKGKTLKQIIRIVEEEKLKTLDTTTVNNSLNRVSTFFGWACKNDYIRKNIASGLFVRDDLREDEERPIYSKEDLVKILKALKKLSTDEKAYRYWIPLIALTSGMRQNEICQLHVSDIIKIDKINCYDINSKDEDKKLKTKSSKRLVPIHPDIIKIGFLNYVKKVQKEGHKIVWHNLEPKLGDYGQRFQRYYTVFNRKIVGKDSKKVFHSFRHTFASNLKQHGVSEVLIGELLGHSNDSVTSRYAKRHDQKTYLEEIKKLDFGFNIVKILTA